MVFSKKVLLALLPFFLQSQEVSGQSTGTTTRYWDCCKSSCGWTGKTSVSTTPVVSCDKNDNPLTDFSAKSACDNGGPAFMCTNQSPWAVSETLSYGFAATTIAGGTESSWCCSCYQLTFTSGPVAGKQMIVQATNTGGDLGSNQFDLAMPGGGFGIFNGCSTEWGTPSTGWGAQYGGISTRSQCDAFPSHLQAGCYWRFDWFQNADNPSVSFVPVTCPAALTAKSGCTRSGQTPTGPSSVSTYTGPGTGTGTATSAPTSTTTISPPGSTGGGGGGSGSVAKYGQCGGTGYTGPTACEAGTTCTVSNPYYSQCL